MNPIGFKQLGDHITVISYDAETLAAATPGDCPHRGTEVASKTGTLTAPCGFLATECARTVGVDEATCRLCRCHGPATLANAYLVRLLVQVGYQATNAGRMSLEPKTPTDDELATALENIRMHLGDEIARRYVDTLVYNESITAAKGDALLATIEAV